MTSIIWANILLAMPFLLAWIVVPLWITFKHPRATPGLSEAHAYLAAKHRQSAMHRPGWYRDIAGQLESQLVG